MTDPSPQQADGSAIVHDLSSERLLRILIEREIATGAGCHAHTETLHHLRMVSALTQARRIVDPVAAAGRSAMPDERPRGCPNTGFCAYPACLSARPGGARGCIYAGR